MGTGSYKGRPPSHIFVKRLFHLLCCWVLQACRRGEIPPREHLEEGKLCFSHGWRGSVCAWLALLLLACDKAETAGGAQVRNILHFLASRKQRETGRGKGPINSNLLPPERPHLLKFLGLTKQ